MTSSRPPSPRKLTQTILLTMMLSWGLAITAVMVMVGLSRGADNGRVVLDARNWVARWAPPMNALPVATVGDCGQGPDLVCAVVIAPVPEGGDAMVHAWPRYNWAKAWLPLASWRVAHAAARHAGDSGYGRRVLAAGAEGVSRVPDPSGHRRTTPTPSWRLSMIVAPTDPSRSDAVEQGATPAVSQRPYGPVVRFGDGMELPARQEDGRWYVLAQGPMNQAQRFAAALMGNPDPGPSIGPATPLPRPTGADGRAASNTPASTGRSSRPTLTLDPATLLAVPDDRPDRDHDARTEARDGLRSARPDPQDEASSSATASHQVSVSPSPRERTRDRDRLRELPRNERPMLEIDEP